MLLCGVWQATSNHMDKARQPLLIGAVAVLAAFTVWITWLAKRLESGQPSGTQARLRMRQPAPDFSLMGLDGRTVTLSEFKGQKKVVVSFWSSSSLPCRRELASLRSMYKRQDELGFAILTVNVDTDARAAERYAKEQQLPFSVLLDPSRQAARAFGVEVVPSLFVIDKRGIVAYSTRGLSPMLETSMPTLLQTIDKLPARGGFPPDAGRN
jgi:peroxiredoxin